MRLGRIGDVGKERPVVVGADGSLLDLSPVCPDITPVFLATGGLKAVRHAVETGQLAPIDAEPDVRIGAPLNRPPKVLCIGLNYSDHAEESAMDLPVEPILFAKMPNTVVGPNDTVLIPRGSTKTDYEVELAVVIGREAKYLSSESEAMDAIAGYTISNDVSEREFQLERGGQWIKGKSCETFNPLGPWLVTADEVGDPQTLGLRLWVNDKLRQDGTTKNMVFDVAHLVWYVSQFLVLEPGDVINTGTPSGVAFGSDGIPYLRPGDVVELEIDGLGRQRQVIAPA